MCGRTGLNTVGSCERATTTCPPFLRFSAASTTPRSSRGPSARAAPAPPKRPRAARRESSLSFEGSLPSGRREKSAGTRVMGVPPGATMLSPRNLVKAAIIPRPRRGEGRVRGETPLPGSPAPKHGEGKSAPPAELDAAPDIQQHGIEVELANTPPVRFGVRARELRIEHVVRDHHRPPGGLPEEEVETGDVQVLPQVDEDKIDGAGNLRQIVERAPDLKLHELLE